MAYIYVQPIEPVYAKVYRVHRGGLTSSIDIKTKYPNIYKTLTTSDFSVGYVSDNDQPGREFGNGGKNDTYYSTAEPYSLSYSYDPSSGILSISQSDWKATNWKNPETAGTFGYSGLTIEVFMIVDGVRSQYT